MDQVRLRSSRAAKRLYGPDDSTAHFSGYIAAAAHPPIGSRVACQRHLVVTHLLDVIDERPDGLEEAAELGALAEAGEMSLLGIPFDPNHVLGRVLDAVRNLVALTVFGNSKRFACTSAGLGEGLRPTLVDAVADVLDDHASPPLDQFACLVSRRRPCPCFGRCAKGSARAETVTRVNAITKMLRTGGR